MTSKFEQLTQLSESFSPLLQNKLQQLNAFSKQDKPKISWICTEKHLLRFWEEQLKEKDLPISYDVILLNQPLSAEQYLEWAPTNALCIATTVIQLVTEPIFQLLQELKAYPIPLFVILHGWEQIGAAPGIVDQEVNEAMTAFPIPPVRVIPVANEKMAAKYASIALGGTTIQTVHEWLLARQEEVHAKQVEALEGAFLLEGGKEVQEQIRLKQQLIIRLKSEVNMANRTTQLHRSSETPITAYILGIYQKLHAALFAVDAKEVISNFESSLEKDLSSGKSIDSHLLQTSLLNQYEQQLQAVPQIEARAELAYQQFANILKKDWQKNIEAWNSLQESDTAKSTIQLSFEDRSPLAEIEAKVMEEASNLLSGLMQIITFQVDREFNSKKTDIVKFLKRDYQDSAPSAPDQEPHEEDFRKSIKPKEFIKDIMQSANLIKKDSLENSIQSMIYNINEACYLKFEEQKELQIQKITMQQQASLETYHFKILAEMKQALQIHQQALDQLTQLNVLS